MPPVIREGDIATGHTDIVGNQIHGVVQSGSCSQTIRNGGKKIATSSTFVNFPSHPHALDEFGNPTDYQIHSIKISATGKHRAESKNIAVDGDVVPVGDYAGPDANVQSSTTSLNVGT